MRRLKSAGGAGSTATVFIFIFSWLMAGSCGLLWLMWCWRVWARGARDNTMVITITHRSSFFAIILVAHGRRRRGDRIWTNSEPIGAVMAAHSIRRRQQKRQHSQQVQNSERCRSSRHDENVDDAHYCDIYLNFHTG